jgi:hypothetical protein
MELKHIFSIEIEGGMRFFVLMTGESEKSVFGVPVSDLDVTEDAGTP